MYSITDGNLEIVHLVRVEAVTLPESHLTCRKRTTDSFVYVVSGGCDLHTADGKTFVQQAGDIHYHPLHTRYTLDVHPGGYAYIVCDFNCASRSSRQPLCFHTKTPQKYEALFQKLLANFTSDEPFCKATSYSLLYQIYAQIVLDHSTDYLSGSARQIMESARSFILANLSDPSLSVAQIARHVQISEGHLRRLFHQKYGMSPMKYIVETRIKKAKMLLDLGEMQIWEIAQQVGYASSTYFSSVFHAATGTTATQYRQRFCKTK